MKFSHSLRAKSQTQLNAPSRGTTTARIAKVPYLNTVPFFRGVSWEERFEVVECVPRELGRRAAAGEVTAGPLPLADYFKLEDAFERLGHFGIAVRGRAHSVLLFSRKPLRQLDGATIAVTHETSTSAILLRLVLEERYRLLPAAYQRVADLEAARPPGPPLMVAGAGGSNESRAGDALLLIGNEALRFKQANTQYPFEIDVAFEWWLWQHLPFVFAVWAIRKDAGAKEKQQVEAGLARSLSINMKELAAIAEEQAQTLGVPADELRVYLESFVYRLGPDEEAGIKQFKELANEHHLL